MPVSVPGARPESVCGRVLIFAALPVFLNSPFQPIWFILAWLNQVELWFERIEREVVARGVFTSVNNTARNLMRYIRHYNQHAAPIKWAYQTSLTESLPLLIQLLQATSECANRWHERMPTI